eukprot:2095328-Rhodomonas_salina.2
MARSGWPHRQMRWPPTCIGTTAASRRSRALKSTRTCVVHARSPAATISAPESPNALHVRSR